MSGKIIYELIYVGRDLNGKNCYSSLLDKSIKGNELTAVNSEYVDKIELEIRALSEALDEAILDILSVFMNASHDRISQAEEIHRDSIKAIREALGKVK